MGRRRKSSFLEDFITLAALLPWWACLLLAAISFAVFHMLAGTTTAGMKPPEVISRSLWIGLGMAGQFLAPLAFLVAAVASGFRDTQRREVPEPIPDARPTESAPVTGHIPEIPDPDHYDTWKDVSKTGASRPIVDTSRWSMELLKALEWKRFEQLCAGYFETLDFKSKVAREGADGGIDIHLYAEGANTPAVVVQCKAWRNSKVGEKPLRELLGVMTATRIPEGVFVTTSGYTTEARQFAAANSIDLIDGEDLLRKIAATTAEHQAALLQLATAGDFWTPTCPSCGIKLVERVAQKSGVRFWGCARFPRCRYTMPQRSN